MSKYQKYLKVLELHEPINLDMLENKYKYLKELWNPDKFKEDSLKERAVKKLEIIDTAYNYLLNDLGSEETTETEKNTEINDIQENILEDNENIEESNNKYYDYKVNVNKEIDIKVYDHRFYFKLCLLFVILGIMYNLSTTYPKVPQNIENTQNKINNAQQQTENITHKNITENTETKNKK